MRGSVAPSLVLATVGVVATAALTAMAAHHLLPLTPLQSMLLGSVAMRVAARCTTPLLAVPAR